ncbi:MAG: SDR family oxidoreductase [Litoreibacter sp.]|nr:SDR family oxidoreductase [Litoreibacter sp.]MCY4336622.1 SDR family oxidoreductase [Litoreibacter sp.]
MTDRLAGKTALLSAAGQGIGHATALAFAAQGAQVIATDINADTLATLDGVEGITTRLLDVTNADQVTALTADIGPVDCLFNCAGFVANGSILDGTEKEWMFSFELNVFAMHRMIQATLPGMLDQGGGSIINISSVASSIKGVVNRYAYSTTKAAVIGMTKSVAADYVTRGVRCNAICPGTVDSPSMHQRLRDTGDYEAAHAAFIARQPMGRIGTAEEIAAMAVYLASDESKFTTGQALAVDGGWSI